MQVPTHRVAGRSPFAHEVLHNGSNYLPGVETDVPVCAPPCECNECQTHFYTSEEQFIDRYRYGKVLSDNEARVLLDDYVKQLHRDREHVTEQLKLHGDLLLSRWKKRTLQKRATLLLQAEPDLCQQKWPLPRLTYQDGDGAHWHEWRRQRKSCLLPYLDAETLKRNPSILFGLLEYRTKNHPQEWAAFDSQQMTCQFALGALGSDFNAGAVVMHGEHYGTLTAWDEDRAHRFDIIGFPRGRLIIEAQALLMGFLRKVVDLLLETIPEDNHGSAVKWSEMIDHGLKSSGDTIVWSQYVHQPFSAPPRFSAADLVSQAQARVDDTGDHLWLLQTEPAYVRRYISLLEQTEVVGSLKGKSLGKEMIAWEIINDVKIHWFWKDALVEFQHAERVYRRFQDSVHRGQPLPKQYDDILAALELRLVNEMHTRSKQLQAIIPQRPGFRHLFDFDLDTGKRALYYQKKPNLSTSQLFEKEPLYWCLMQLQGPPDDQRAFPKQMLFEFLDDHLRTSPTKERARLDELLYDKLSDYATISEMLGAVRLHTPRNKIADLLEVRVTENRRAWTRSGTFEFSKASLGESLKKFYAIPLPSGRKDQRWLQDFETVHRSLQNFWQVMFNLFQTTYKASKTPVDIIVSDLDDLSRWNSPEYARSLEVKREQILADINKPKPTVGEFTFFPLPPSTGREDPSRFQAQKRREKVKTRTEYHETVPNNEPDAYAPQLEQLSLDSPRPSLLVTKRSYATFRSLFPELPEERQNSVEWDTFVASMEDAGFSARNEGGSVVSFEEQTGAGKINFHRPHPATKIDPIMLQSIGKRMNKWFGWERSTFTVVVK